MGDVADLTAKAYEIIRLIPYGHVTTYGLFNASSVETKLKHLHLGHIAKLAGYPTYSRYVCGELRGLIQH
jgi:methylated-DNA-protein-cysteine methyltransferase-like protein